MPIVFNHSLSVIYKYFGSNVGTTTGASKFSYGTAIICSILSMVYYLFYLIHGVSVYSVLYNLNRRYTQ